MQERMYFLPSQEQIQDKIDSFNRVITAIESVTPDTVQAALDTYHPEKNNMFQARAEVMIIRRGSSVIEGIQDSLKKASAVLQELDDTLKTYDLTPGEAEELRGMATSTPEVQAISPFFVEDSLVENKLVDESVPDRNDAAQNGSLDTTDAADVPPKNDATELEERFLEMKPIYFALVAKLIQDTEPKKLTQHSIEPLDPSIASGVINNEEVQRFIQFQDPAEKESLTIVAVRQIRRALESKLFDSVFENLPKEEQDFVWYLLDNAQQVYELVGLQKPTLLPDRV